MYKLWISIQKPINSRKHMAAIGSSHFMMIINIDKNILTQKKPHQCLCPKYKRTQYTFIISYCYSMFSFANMSLRYFQIVYFPTASPSLTNLVSTHPRLLSASKWHRCWDWHPTLEKAPRVCRRHLYRRPTQDPMVAIIVQALRLIDSS